MTICLFIDYVERHTTWQQMRKVLAIEMAKI